MGSSICDGRACLDSCLASPLCDNTPLAGPLDLNLLNRSSPARGISHFFTDTQNTTYTTERVEEKRTNKHRLGLAPNARREKFVTLLCSSPSICRLLQACIRARFPQSHQECCLIFSRWPTRRLDPPILAVACSLLSISLFCPLLRSGSFSSLPGTFLPSSSFGLVLNLAHKSFVWVSRQNR